MKIIFILLILFGISCAEIPSDYCRGLNGVTLPHPDPTRCTEFIICILEISFPFNCQRPNEIFYPPAGDCQPGNTETCELFINTTPQTTTTTTVTDVPTTTTEEITTTTTTEEITTTTELLTTTTEEITTTTTTIQQPTTTTPIDDTTTTTILTTTTEPGPEITTTTTSNPITTTTQRPIGPPELCIGNNGRNVADPEFCFRFYHCMLGFALPGECARDRIFSERWRGCVLGDWETCIPRSPILPWNIKIVKYSKKF